MKKFFALSRSTHAVLDLAAPVSVVLLVSGRFPSWQVSVLALFTAFAGYTAVYAMNDLMGFKDDREKFACGINAGYSVESSVLRHPLARNILSFRGGMAWFALWMLLSIIGSWMLNPLIVPILLAAAVLEVIYCRLFKVTCLRTFVSGLVKSGGPLAALFVATRNPSWSAVFMILLWVFLWEIGGQNIPADWNDTEEDRRVKGKTIPLELGTQKAGMIVLLMLTSTIITSMFLPVVSPLSLNWKYLVPSAIIGIYLLLLPGFQLFRQQKEGRRAARLFDHASYYPLAQMILLSVFVIIE
jgi:4-hydroxybenzoate polyprenyltransferase